MDLLSLEKIPELGRLNKRDALDFLREHMISKMSEGDTLDEVLELALDAMSLLLVLDKDYQRNIRGYNAGYSFKSRDGKVSIGVVFKSWSFLFFHFPKMEVKTRALENPNIAVTFESSGDMAKFLLSPQPDLLDGVLDNKLKLDGNINYILKFVYMARRIPHILGIQPL